MCAPNPLSGTTLNLPTSTRRTRDDRLGELEDAAFRICNRLCEFVEVEGSRASNAANCPSPAATFGGGRRRRVWLLLHRLWCTESGRGSAASARCGNVWGA